MVNSFTDDETSWRKTQRDTFFVESCELIYYELKENTKDSDVLLALGMYRNIHGWPSLSQ